MIDKYRIEKELGRGAIGVVYEAYDTTLQRRVAIKVLRGNFDADGRDRFVRGAQSLAQLRHPSIVNIFQCGQVDAQPYLVMEYVVGESLRSVIDRKQPLELARKLQII